MSQRFTQEKRSIILNEWATSGVSGHRERSLAETEFHQKVEALTGPIFRPLPVKVEGDGHFQAELAHLIDSLDLIRIRPDLSVDAIWRSCESALRLEYHESKRTNKQIESLAANLPAPMVSMLWAEAPDRVFKYLAKRCIRVEEAANFASWGNNKMANRMKDHYKNSWSSFEDLFNEKYSNRELSSMRDPARLLRMALLGESVHVEGTPLTISSEVSAGLLTVGFMYQLRNDRTHADTMPVILSSRANIATYSLPLFAYVSMFSCLSLMWLNRYPEIGYTAEQVLQVQSENLARFKGLLGSAWN